MLETLIAGVSDKLADIFTPLQLVLLLGCFGLHNAVRTVWNLFLAERKRNDEIMAVQARREEEQVKRDSQQLERLMNISALLEAINARVIPRR